MKHFILYLFLLFAAFNVQAQIGSDADDLSPKKEEKIQALYIAYITQQLALTPAEAEKFWPLHAQYDAEIKALNTGNNGNEIDKQQAILNVKKKYAANFNKIIGSDRSNNFYKQDEGFRRKLMERLNKMRQQRNAKAAQGQGATRRKQ